MLTPRAVTFSEVSSLVGAFAWPVVALVIVLIFRVPLLALLRRDDVEIKAFGSFSVSAKGQDAAAHALIEAAETKPATPLTPADAKADIELATVGVNALGRPPQIL